MNCRSMLWRTVAGTCIGAVMGLGLIPSNHSAWSGTYSQLSSALAANSCQYYVNSEFTGIRDNHYGASNPASAISGQISINQPGFICNSGASYWVMVHQTGTQCNGRGGYDQVGWIIDGYGNPQHYYEQGLVNQPLYCDLGPQFDMSGASWSTNHTYKVVVGGQAGGGTYASFYKDGVLLNSLSQDWASANEYQASAEIHYSEEYLGGQTFRGLLHCEGFTGCTPNVAVNVGADCPSGNTYGCAPSSNPNGCYYFNSSVTTYNGFNVYEKRSKSPPSC